MAAVVYAQDFLKSKNKIYKNYEDYVDYIENKSKTKINNLKKMYGDDYVYYIGNETKTYFRSFNYKKNLKDNEVKKIRNEFKNARKNGCNLYRGVFSFETPFLIENGLIDKNKNVLDETKLIESIQKSVHELHKLSRINYDDFIWIANYHFNEEHVHCHIAYIDKNEYKLSSEQQEKMVVNSKGFQKVRAKFINNVVNNKKEYEKISELRNNIKTKLKTTKLTSNNTLFNLYCKYGNKLLYLNTKKSQFKQEEIDNILNIVKNDLYKDLELNNLIRSYRNEVQSMNLKMEYYYGKNDNDYARNKLEIIDNMILTSIKQTYRDIKNNNPEILILLEKKKHKKGIRSNINIKDAEFKIRKIIKRNMYKEIENQQAYNMKIYNEITKL